MNNENKKPSFLLTASTTELLQMPIEVIQEEVSQHFLDLRKDFAKGSVSDKAVKALDRRLAHTAILMVEAGRLQVTHPEEAEKIFLATIFWKNTEGLNLIAPERKQAIEDCVRKIEEEEKRKEEERKEKERKLGIRRRSFLE